MTMAPERPLQMEEAALNFVSVVPETSVVDVHERHFGNIEFQKLGLNSLILFSQIRDKLNPRFAELEESIDHDDLDNPVNVARMTSNELSAYIAFTNKTWGAATRLADFVDYVQPDGRYNVVAAGHSRTISMRNIAQKHTLATGQPTNYTVLCKIEKDNSVEAIVSKQFLENIHAAVPPHREAEAIIEMYQQGLGSKWAGPDEFRTTYGKVISKAVLDKALAYGLLPQEVRNLVVSKHLHYAVAVEQGKRLQVLRTHKALTYNLPVNEPLPEDLEKAILYQLMGDCMLMHNQKFKQSAAVQYVRSQTTAMLAEIQELSDLAEDSLVPTKKQKSEDGVLDLEDFMISTEEQYRMDMSRERHRRAREAKEVFSKPYETTARFMQALFGDTSDDPLVELVFRDAETELQILVERRQRVAESAGGLALLESGSKDEDLPFAV